MFINPLSFFESFVKPEKNSVKDRLSKTFQVDLAYFTNVGIYTNLRLLVTVIFGLLFSLVLTRYLNPSDLGRYYFILAILGTFTLFSLSGMDTAVMSSFLKGNYSSYTRAIRLQILFSLIGSFILLSFCAYAYFTHNEMARYFLLLALILPFLGIDFFTARIVSACSR